MVSCTACGRSRTNNTKEKGITFHHFPKQQETKKCWMVFVNKPNWTPSKNSFLCSLHFADNCFDRSSLLKVRLRENAIPTIIVTRIKYVRSLCKEDLSQVQQHFMAQTVQDPLQLESDLFRPSTIVCQLEDESQEEANYVCKIKDDPDEEGNYVCKIKEEPEGGNNVYKIKDEPEEEGNYVCEFKNEPEEEANSVCKLDDEPGEDTIYVPSQTFVPTTSLQITTADSPPKVFLKRKLSEMYKLDNLKSKKIRYLQKQNWAQRKKIATLSAVILELKNTNLLSEGYIETIFQKFGPNNGLIKRLLQKST